MSSGGSRCGAGRKRTWDRPSARVNVPIDIAHNFERLIKDLDADGLDDSEKIRLWESAKAQKIRKYNSPVSAGAHMTSSITGDSLHSDYEEVNLLNLLIPNPGSMDLLTVEGDSMIDIGIFPGDLLIVERTNIAKDHDIVIVRVDVDDVMVKRLRLKDKSILLISENKQHSPIDISDREYQILGVVKKSIRCDL